MFDAKVYSERRNQLKNKLKTGVLFFLGNDESPMNYAANAYPFRQDSSFLYYWGLDSPGLAAIMDLDEDKEIIFGYDFTVDDIVWMGPQPTIAERAEWANVHQTGKLDDLSEYIKEIIENGRKIHYLPQYRPDNLLRFESLMGIRANFVNQYVSEELIKAVVAQRSIKSDEEIAEIEKALEISYQMHTTAMQMTKHGIYEREVVGAMQGITDSMGEGISFPTIFSVHGETLHNHYHGNLMKDGNIIVNDSGAESALHYASDITRTIPVSGKFTEKQKEIYEIVLNAQLTAIDAIKADVKFKDVHLKAAKVIAEGMKNLGFIKGDVDEVVEQGAHALFFPHGLGHMMGLDVHDMENLGEQYVGYDEDTERSTQFGLAALRLGKALQPGFVVTVEPGIYFIPELIDMWKAEEKFIRFLDYDKIESYKGFGGIRIEDDVLVTESGSKVLGKPIPKTIQDIEEVMNR